MAEVKGGKYQNLGGGKEKGGSPLCFNLFSLIVNGFHGGQGSTSSHHPVLVQPLVMPRANRQTGPKPWWRRRRRQPSQNSRNDSCILPAVSRKQAATNTRRGACEYGQDSLAHLPKTHLQFSGLLEPVAFTLLSCFVASLALCYTHLRISEVR